MRFNPHEHSEADSGNDRADSERPARPDPLRDLIEGFGYQTVPMDSNAVMIDGKIVRSGDKSLALELEEKGYAWLEERVAAGASA